MIFVIKRSRQFKLPIDLAEESLSEALAETGASEKDYYDDKDITIKSIKTFLVLLIMKEYF